MLVSIFSCGEAPDAGPSPMLEIPEKARDAVQQENQRTNGINESISETMTGEGGR